MIGATIEFYGVLSFDGNSVVLSRKTGSGRRSKILHLDRSLNADFAPVIVGCTRTTSKYSPALLFVLL